MGTHRTDLENSITYTCSQIFEICFMDKGSFRDISVQVPSARLLDFGIFLFFFDYSVVKFKRLES